MDEFIRWLCDERFEREDLRMIRYDQKHKEFTIIPPYPIANKDCKHFFNENKHHISQTINNCCIIELKEFLLKRMQPIIEDLDLYACYRGIKSDLAELK